MAQSVPDPNDPVACVLGQPGAEDRETDFLNRRTRRDGRAIWLKWLYQNLLPSLLVERIPMFSPGGGPRLVGGLLDPLGHSGRPF